MAFGVAFFKIKKYGFARFRHAAPRNQHPRNQGSARRLREIAPRLGGSAVGSMPNLAGSSAQYLFTYNCYQLYTTCTFISRKTAELENSTVLGASCAVLARSRPHQWVKMPLVRLIKVEDRGFQEPCRWRLNSLVRPITGSR